MNEYSTLVQHLESTENTAEKKQALIHFFEVTSDEDKLWFLALFCGKEPKRVVKTSQLKQWAMDYAQISEWLFKKCHSQVGDISHTLALLIPNSGIGEKHSLNEWISILSNLQSTNQKEQQEIILREWNYLDQADRVTFNQLLTGKIQITLSKKLLVRVLSIYTNQEENHIMHAISGTWDPKTISFQELVSGVHISSDLSKPYPFCLATKFMNKPSVLGPISDWVIEQLWGGVRAQLIKRDRNLFIWSENGELITDKFPDLIEPMLSIDSDFVFDGELVVLKNGEVRPVHELEQRLNRKRISNTVVQKFPVRFVAFDCFEWHREDVRDKPLFERLELFRNLGSHIPSGPIVYSKQLLLKHWEEAEDIQKKARQMYSEGLLLRKKNSLYDSMNTASNWLYWNADPYTIDAVLINAQRHRGLQQGLFSEYTFAVQSPEGLVPIAKTKGGLSPQEVVELSDFVNQNTLERFGPVRTVKPQLVFQLTFDGISSSNRRKSGVVLRSPRIAKWYKHNHVSDPSQLSQVQNLLKGKQ